MPQPTKFTRNANYTDYEGSFPTTPKSGVSLDSEFNELKSTTDQIIDNIALIQKDDGTLANDSVGVDQLAPGATAAVEAAILAAVQVSVDAAAVSAAAAATSATGADTSEANAGASAASAASSATTATTRAGEANAAKVTAVAAADAALVSETAAAVSSSTASGHVTSAAASAAAALVSADVASDAAETLGERLIGTSETSVLIGIGGKAFLTQPGKAFVTGMSVSAFQTSAVQNYVAGRVLDYNSSTGNLSILVDETGGSGTPSDWTIILASGPAGPAGVAGVAGPGGAPGGATTQIQYNNAGAFAGSTALTWNNASRVLTVGVEGTGGQVKGADATTTDQNGGPLSLDGGKGNGIGIGGSAILKGGDGSDAAGPAGHARLEGGNPQGGNANGGNVYLTPTLAEGAGINGNLIAENIPTVDPVVTNAIWADGGVLAKSGSTAGNVKGPASAVADRIAAFDGTTGKLLKDGGATIAGLQPVDAFLTSIAALGTAADKMIYTTAADTAAEAALTAAGRAILDDADAAAQRTTLGAAAASHTHAIADLTDDGALAALNSVGAAQIDDNSVGLAELDHGTQGDVLYYGASGAPTRLGQAGDGKMLMTHGAAADPTWAFPLESFIFALSDETTAITTGVAKLTIRWPYAFTITSVKASLNVTSSSGIPTFDINEAGVTILSTKITVDAGELTSATAAVPPVVSDAAIAADAEITFDIDVAGTGAKGAKITVIGRQT